jgi:hypothetical protein
MIFIYMSKDFLKEDLAVWFGTKKKPKGSKQPQGPWVNICRKDKNGKHPTCGRPEADDKGYPKRKKILKPVRVKNRLELHTNRKTKESGKLFLRS